MVDEIKDDEIGGTCSIQERNANTQNALVPKSEENRLKGKSKRR
jgi:hypothetical protein